MEVKQEIKDNIIATAERMIYYNNGIIEICDNWMPAEEANANMMREIEERRRKERAEIMNHEKRVNRFWKWTRMKLRIEN